MVSPVVTPGSIVEKSNLSITAQVYGMGEADPSEDLSCSNCTVCGRFILTASCEWRVDWFLGLERLRHASPNGYGSG